jgi:hypothetical protein
MSDCKEFAKEFSEKLALGGPFQLSKNYNLDECFVNHKSGNWINRFYYIKATNKDTGADVYYHNFHSVFISRSLKNFKYMNTFDYTYRNLHVSCFYSRTLYYKNVFKQFFNK